MDKLSILAQYSANLDHVAIAVKDLESAIGFYQNLLGFELVERREVAGKWSGMKSAVMQAGSIIFVLMQGTSPESQICQYIEHYGTGVQHLAIKVDNLAQVKQDLERRGLKFSVDVINSPGLNQAFSVRDENSGIMIEIIERSPEAKGNFTDKNVQNLFEKLEEQNLF